MIIHVDSHTDCMSGKRDPLLNRILPGGESLLMLTDGSEMAFAHSYQPVMDLVRESFLDSLSRSTGSARERLELAVIDLETLMHERFPSSDRFGEDTYAATFLAALISGDQGFLGWIGSQQAKLFRGRRCVGATVPHVTVVPGTDRGDFVVTSRVLCTSADQSREVPDIEGPWRFMPGDVLVVADYRLFSLFSDDELIAILANEPTSAARSLAEEAQRKKPDFMRSSLIARFAC